MTAQPKSDLRRTPLYGEHLALDARMVAFGGWAMPVQYAAGIREEHRAVREEAGLFDVSHMGEFRVRGPDALRLVGRALTNDPTRLEPGGAQYSVMCREDGGILDDLVVYRLDEEDFRLVVNAANIERDFRQLETLATGLDVRLEDESERVALLALQGPRAQELLAPLCSEPLDPVGFYRFVEGEVAGAASLVSRTGYTGEDGFELYLPSQRAAEVWRALLEAGGEAGPAPAGLGARDTLRLEMGYALYGKDIDLETTPLEAGLGWLVKPGREESFVGEDALVRQKEEGLERRLRGFRLTERGFPREGYPVLFRGEEVGRVRSGTVSPTLGYGIGTVYLPADAAEDEELAVVIRGKEVAGRVERTPFYRDGSLRR